MVVVGVGAGALLDQATAGLLEVRVCESNHGLTIIEFIPGTSAAQLHAAGETMVAMVGDCMVCLNGRRLRCVADVFAVTDQLKAGVDYAVLDLVTRAGHPYQLYIMPSKGGAPATCSVKTSRQKVKGAGPSHLNPTDRPPRTGCPRD